MANNIKRAIRPMSLGVYALTTLLFCSACDVNFDPELDSSGGTGGTGGTGGFGGHVGCGDGSIAANEECDDGNALNGDCCSAACQFESAGAACSDVLCSNGDASGACNGAGTCATDSLAATGQCFVFLTSGSYHGDFGGLEGADAICQDLAASVGLPGNYKAWLSDSQTNASDRLTHSIVPYVRVDGAVVAQSWDDLTDGSGLSNAISVSEGGYDWYNACSDCFLVPGGCGAVWTATAPNGSQDRNTCSDWTNEDATGGEGIYCLETDSSWTQWPDGSTSVDCWHARSFYCFQQ